MSKWQPSTCLYLTGDGYRQYNDRWSPINYILSYYHPDITTLLLRNGPGLKLHIINRKFIEDYPLASTN